MTSPTRSVRPTVPSLKEAVEKLLSAAVELSLEPGYVNGPVCEDWHVRASRDLLHALADVTLAYSPDLERVAENFKRLSRPVCAEPLGYSSEDFKVCIEPVGREGEPCPAHTPERAAELGRCTYPVPPHPGEPQRICHSEPAPEADRCSNHLRYCRAVKLNGEICNSPFCSVPKHRRSEEARR